VAAEAGGMPAAAVGTGVVVVTAAVAAVVAAGRRVTPALAVIARALAAELALVNRVSMLVTAAGTGVRTTVVTRNMRRRWAVMAMPTAIGHLTNHARPTRIIAATAPAVRGRNINARSKPVGMGVPANRLVVFPLAVADSGALAADGRAGAGKCRAAPGKYYCGGPTVGRRDPATYEPLPGCGIRCGSPRGLEWRVSVLRHPFAVSV
jgi:hypothetical protein